MNRSYTRTGDAGTTGIHGGSRVPKDDPRIEAPEIWKKGPEELYK